MSEKGRGKKKEKIRSNQKGRRSEAKRKKWKKAAFAC